MQVCDHGFTDVPYADYKEEEIKEIFLKKL